MRHQNLTLISFFFSKHIALHLAELILKLFSYLIVRYISLATLCDSVKPMPISSAVKERVFYLSGVEKAVELKCKYKRLLAAGFHSGDEEATNAMLTP